MKEFDPFANAKRNYALDQPRLQSGVNGFEDYAIPPQIGITLENGTDVQVSYARAVALGLIAKGVIPTVSIEKYVKHKTR